MTAEEHARLLVIRSMLSDLEQGLFEFNSTRKRERELVPAQLVAYVGNAIMLADKILVSAAEPEKSKTYRKM